MDLWNIYNSYIEITVMLHITITNKMISASASRCLVRYFNKGYTSHPNSSLIANLKFSHSYSQIITDVQSGRHS
jgi:hypothetical protein